MLSTGVAAAGNRSSRRKPTPQRRVQDEAPACAPREAAVLFGGDGEAVRRRAGGWVACSSCVTSPALPRVRSERSRLCQDADSTSVIHGSILASHKMRCNHNVDQRENEMSGTLAEGVGEHVVRRGTDGAPDLLYVDLHLDPRGDQPAGASRALRLAGRRVRRPDLHDRDRGPQHAHAATSTGRIADLTSRTQIETLRAQLRRVRRPAALARGRRPGHRARRRARSSGLTHARH